jgi:glucosamine 6-phosphate synthetase-like amidotransferase/phosphosugar isomerase protein
MTDTTPALPPMRRDIARQPQVLTSLLARVSDFVTAGETTVRPGAGGRVFVCGCGDGYFAAHAATMRAREAGLDWRPIGALDLILEAKNLSSQDRVVAISMSGNVDRTVEAARAVQERGVPLLAVVNGDGGRLGAIATAKISLDLSDLAPFLCGTSSYVATVAALMAIAIGAGGRGSAATIGAAVPAQAEAIAASARVLDGPLAMPTGVRLLSAGADRGTVRYGAAKIVELTRLPVWSGDLEEFAHSQYWSMPTSDLVVVVAVEPVLAGYADEACAALAELGVMTIAIDTRAAPVQRARTRITLPGVQPSLAPLATAIPLQLLAYRLAELDGLDPNTRLHLKNDEQRFKVSRMLTRRSLLGTGQ